MLAVCLGTQRAKSRKIWRLSDMFTLSKTIFWQRKGGRRLFRNYIKYIWSKRLVLAGLGAMVVTMLCILSSCGSDNSPGGSVKGNNVKIATSLKPEKIKERVSLLVDKEETGPRKMGKIKHQPELIFVEPIHGVTQEELDLSASANRKILELPDTEIFPGMTQAELDAQNVRQEVPNIRELVPPSVIK
jgi:hypothetical protein